MKKIIVIALGLVLCLSLTACFGNTEIKSFDSTAFEKKITIMEGFVKGEIDGGAEVFKNDKLDAILKIYKYIDKTAAPQEIITEFVSEGSTLAEIGFIAPVKAGYEKKANVYGLANDKYNLVVCYAKAGEAYLISVTCKTTDYPKYITEFEKSIKNFEI